MKISVYSGIPLLICCGLFSNVTQGQVVNNKYGQPDKFRQLEEILPTPNEYRNASGAPGHAYWQQKVDYDIKVSLDEKKNSLTGSEVITYTNNSPDTLKYLWLQLDQNRFDPSSNDNRHQTASPIGSTMSYGAMEKLMVGRTFPGGYTIDDVSDAASKKKLSHFITGTSMRIDLTTPLATGESVGFRVSWSYNIVDGTLIRARGGFERFEEDGNNIYEIAQWFPRLCAYSDLTGWQHKEFLGSGEFTLEFGDYTVAITAPADHIVASTGELINPDDVLTAAQKERLNEAESAKNPVFVVTPEEAKKNEEKGSDEVKTWIFKARNVRDFAFASSRKFIWDALGHSVNGNKTMAMSYYPNEAEPLWSKYSTHSIVHTLNVYSKYTFDYPYPVAISVNGPVYGMEYPMICFNGPRPEKDGTYTARTKYSLISVIIHEVGHNYFPMIVNSDERQWTWMDEGLNTFLQYLTEVEWEEKYPARRGEPKNITSYMSSQSQVPIMTNSESILQFGANAYAKPATALNVLRETVVGREAFDFAFKEYSQRWMFKRPYPADFFRSMEDASGVDLDWFWRGWFYSTDHVDLAIAGIEHYEINKDDPVAASKRARKKREDAPKSISKQRNKGIDLRVDEYPDLKDFYNSFDDLDVSKEDKKKFQDSLAKLTDEQREMLGSETHFYIVDVTNEGGLVMPVIIKLTHADNSERIVRLPAEIWAKNSKKISRLILSEMEVVSMELDPYGETADTDTSNNVYPPRIGQSRFKLYKASERSSKNEMQKAGLGKKPEKKEKESKKEDKKED
ncbi:MAG: M1 family metallopeptidase [Fuerstiella sp.]